MFMPISDQLQNGKENKMTTKHTAGPWKRQGKFILQEKVINGCSLTIAKIPYAGPDFQTKYNEGDANLIAAAPDLLEACKLINRYYSRKGKPDTSMPKNLAETVRTAIKKATGGTK